MDGQRPFTGRFQARLAVAPGMVQQPQTAAVAVFRVGKILQLALDYFLGGRADLLGPVEEAPG